MARLKVSNQAKSKLLGVAVDFAMSRAGFERSECLLLMEKAYELDDGKLFARLMSWLVHDGSMDIPRAAAWAARAFLSQKLGVMVEVAQMFPSALALERDDGIDLCRGGLTMAITQANGEAALALAQCFLEQKGTDARVLSAIEEGMELAAGEELPGHWLSQSERDERDRSSKALGAKLEALLLAHCTGPARRDSKKVLSL